MSMKVLKPRTGGETTGVVVSLVVGVDGNPEDALVDEYILGEGSAMRFCGRKEVRPFLFGPATALSLTHEYEEESLESTISSIVEGVVEIAGSSEARNLTPNDRVILDELDRAWILLHRDREAFRVSISGKVVAAQIKGNSPVNYGSKDLIPNLLVFLTQSPAALLFGLALGLFGAFWNTVKILYGRLD